MVDKLNFTFGMFIAHFIPGFILLTSFFLFYYNQEIPLLLCNDPKIQINPLLKENLTAVITLATLLSLTIGLIIDALRFLLICFPKIFPWFSDFFIYDESKANEDDRVYMDWIIEHHYRFHQFYGNLSISLFISLIFLILKFKISYYFFVIPTLLFIASIIKYKATLDKIRKRFSN